MQAWFNFYGVIGATTATLMGLLFVALSMNAVAAGAHKDRAASQSRHLKITSPC